MGMEKKINKSRVYPLSIRITNDEHIKLKEIFNKTKKPVATIAYEMLSNSLKEYETK